MKMKDFCSFIDEVMGKITDQELCACFWFHEEQADLELQTALFQNEWREYVQTYNI